MGPFAVRSSRVLLRGGQLEPVCRPAGQSAVSSAVGQVVVRSDLGSEVRF